MRTSKRLATAVLTLSLLAGFPLAAVASDAPSVDETPTVRVAPADTDLVVDVRPSDERPSDPTRRDKISDRRVRDTDQVRDRCLLTDNPRRCLHDRPSDHLNTRQLIWRLIQAQEWEKLVRLLHWLGLI